MSILDRLSAAPGVYWGEGQGPGGGRFVARVCLRARDDGTLTFDYEAWSPQGGLQHAESGRFAHTGSTVTMAATSNGGDDTMIFREGEQGVFGSIGSQRVGLVITAEAERLTLSWWWTGRDGQLREQSRAVVAPMREIVVAPAVPGADLRPVAAPADAVPRQTAQAPAVPPVPKDAVTAGGPAPKVSAEGPGPSGAGTKVSAGGGPSSDRPEVTTDVGARLASAAAQRNAGRASADTEGARAGADGSGDAGSVPWPGILVLHGAGTGLVAQRLAARLTRAAVVRTDLFDRAVRGTAGRPDPVLRQRIALSVVQGYAATGHPVILHGASSRREHEELVAAILRSGLRPVRLVDVADGEDYGEVARRLIESD